MQSIYTLDTFFKDLNAIVSNTNPRFAFVEFFSLNFIKYDATRVASLQQSIQQLDDKQIYSIIESKKIVQRLSWPAFENFLANYLLCIRDIDPWSVINSIDLMITVFESTSILFNPKSTEHESISKLAVPYFKESMSLIIPLSGLIDIESMHIHNRRSDFPRLTHISTILLKALNNIRSTPEINSGTNIPKANLLLQISISLCNVYYKIGSPVLCANVFSNVNILSLNTSYIKKELIVKFRFIMGKYYAHQSSFINSYHHLIACFNGLKLDNCPPSTILLILKYLIPVGLLSGKVCDIPMIRTRLMNNSNDINEIDSQKLHALLNIYELLIGHYKAGNMYGFYKCISENESYWKKIGLWIPMLQRMRIPIFRNLLYSVWRMNGNVLTYDSTKIALSVSLSGMCQLKDTYQVNYNTDEIDDQFVANVISSLAFCGLLKVKMTGGRTFVLGKNDTFPNINKVLCGRYPTSPREAWLDK